MSIKALERYLLPLMPFLQMDGVTEVCINRPQEIFIECNGAFIRYKIEELTLTFLESLAILVAEYNHKDFPSPLLSGSLPGGERIQFVMYPACEKDRMVCSIRRQQIKNLTIDDYQKMGSFDQLAHSKNYNKDVFRELYLKKDTLNFLKQAIQSRKNILISGGTGTGKTTFLNACLQMIPSYERIITVEDVREVNVNNLNSVNLLFNEEDQKISALNIFKTCLRLRPDRIFLSELRGTEVWPYLRAANSGHPGSLSTIHADSPEGAITQLVFMMQQAGSTSSEDRIREYIRSIIHIIVQLKKCTNGGRFMAVSEIYYNEN